jgi:predicted nucleotidyltransferase
LNSVRIKFTDPQRIRKAVIDYAFRLRSTHQEIKRIIWFGSWVTGLPSAGSDVDLCLIISSSDKPLRERIVDYLPVGFPVGIELFAYTESEFEQLKTTSPSWYRSIMKGEEL